MAHYFWAQCAFLNFMTFCGGVVMHDPLLIVGSGVLLGYSLYRFAETIGLL